MSSKTTENRKKQAEERGGERLTWNTHLECVEMMFFFQFKERRLSICVGHFLKVFLAGLFAEVCGEQKIGLTLLCARCKSLVRLETLKLNVRNGRRDDGRCLDLPAKTCASSTHVVPFLVFFTEKIE